MIGSTVVLLVALWILAIIIVIIVIIIITIILIILVIILLGPPTRGVALLVQRSSSTAASIVVCVVDRVKDRHDLLQSSPILHKACVRQVLLDKWFPMIGSRIPNVSDELKTEFRPHFSNPECFPEFRPHWRARFRTEPNGTCRILTNLSTSAQYGIISYITYDMWIYYTLLYYNILYYTILYYTII